MGVQDNGRNIINIIESLYFLNALNLLFYLQNKGINVHSIDRDIMFFDTEALFYYIGQGFHVYFFQWILFLKLNKHILG